MDRQEAIQTLSKVGKISVSYAEDLYDSFFPKPVVPQYVADWYEEHKENIDYELREYLVDWVNQKPSDFKEWLNTNYEAFQTLVNMHQFGYEVEEKTKYRVRVKKITDESKTLKRDVNKTIWFFGDCAAAGISHHTRKELEEADFGWVFDCEGIEIVEVE